MGKLLTTAMSESFRIIREKRVLITDWAGLVPRMLDHKFWDY